MDSLCRTCLADSRELYSVFDVCLSNGDKLEHIISLCANLQIKLHDGLPHMVCDPCITNFVNFFEFRISCHVADNTLKRNFKSCSDNDDVYDEPYTKSVVASSESAEPEQNEDQHAKLQKLAVKKHLESHVDECESSTLMDGDLMKCTICDMRSEAYTQKSTNLGNTECSVRSDLQIVKVNEYIKKTVVDYELSICSKVSEIECGNSEQSSSCPLQSKKKGRTKQVRANRKTVNLTCSICLKVFSQHRSLQAHMETHKETNDYLCTICGENIKTKSLYYDHLKKHDPNKRWQCSECAKVFPRQNQLKSHMNVHTGQKPFKCEFCGIGYTQKSVLTIHRRKHTGETPYRCEQCDANFISLKFLKRHQNRTHTDLNHRPYKCVVCSKTFRDREHFRVHKQIHFGQKNYTCEYCAKKFLFRKGLTVHLRSHTGERPYLCEICNRGFTQRHCLVSHVQRQHKNTIS